MKKLILLLIAICCITVDSVCAINNNDKKEPNPPIKNIEQIIIDKSTDGGLERPRSAVDPIEAYLNHTDSIIEVYFYYMFGAVTITIEDANGNVVNTMECDTDAEEVVNMAAPSTSGEYTIKIVGEDLAAEGTFTI